MQGVGLDDLDARFAGSIKGDIPKLNGIIGRIFDADGLLSVVIGLGLVLAAMLTISSLGLETPLGIAAVGLVLYGMGEALFVPPNNSLIMESARPEELGFVGGLSGFCRMFGQALGVTVATSALYGHMSSEMGTRVSDFVDGRPEVFTHAMSFVFLVLAAVVLVGFIATIYRYVKFLRSQKAAN